VALASLSEHWHDPSPTGSHRRCPTGRLRLGVVCGRDLVCHRDCPSPSPSLPVAQNLMGPGLPRRAQRRWVHWHGPSAEAAATGSHWAGVTQRASESDCHWQTGGSAWQPLAASERPGPPPEVPVSPSQTRPDSESRRPGRARGRRARGRRARARTPGPSQAYCQSRWQPASLSASVLLLRVVELDSDLPELRLSSLRLWQAPSLTRSLLACQSR
jgi:hypothetical protein